MKKRILSIALALCLCLSAVPEARAWQEPAPSRQNVPAAASTDAPAPYAGEAVPTPEEAYAAMIALKEDARYAEGTEWTNYTPYSLSKPYIWQGGSRDGIASGGAGCVAFAYLLSDAAFGNLPARMLSNGSFRFSDVKVGDILRVNGGAHTVIVLRVTDAGVVLAEGNYNSSIHWGRTMSKAEVEAAYQYITRYPVGYNPDGPSGGPVAEGTVGGLTWTLAKTGTLTVSGRGAMPDGSAPWSAYNDQILEIVIENGVTQVGSGAFQNCAAMSAAIPASVKTIGDSAFYGCSGLISVTVSEGVESVGSNAFRGCTALKSIALPASVGSVGDGAFMSCTELAGAVFAPGSKQVIMGDNLFVQCWRLAAVTLPQSIQRVSQGMFQVCGALSSLVIPQGAASIGGAAFASCSSLTQLTIPDSVTQIETGAFSNCLMLKDIYYGGSEAQWNSIGKTADVAVALRNVTVHYSGRPDPGPDEPGHTHAWDSGVVTRPASCTSTGVRTYTCTGCGETRTEAIPALGHSYGPAVVTKEATCTEAGVRTYTCANCGGTKTEAIPALGHSYGPAVVTKEATCTEAGVRTSTCANCGNAKTEAVPALGHSYDQVLVTREATCTEDGEQAAACSRCGDAKAAERIPAKGHDLVLNASGAYECANERNASGESALVIPAPVGEGYLKVKDLDGRRAPSSYRDTASAQRYVSSLVSAALESALLHYTMTTVQFTPPTRTTDGEYIYRLTVQANGQEAAVLTTEPLRMVIPAGKAQDPAPVPRPDPVDTYAVTVLKSTGGEVIPGVLYAAQGASVTLSVRPDTGYELSKITVTGAGGLNVTVRTLSNNRFSFTMPSGKVEINAVFVASQPDPDPVEPPAGSPGEEDSTSPETPDSSGAELNPLPVPFTDVLASQWYYDSVEYVWKHYLMSGVSDTQFAPGQTASRAMIWTILARMDNVQTDAAPGSPWYEKGMRWGMERGVTDGSNPMGDITREQLAAMLWRNAGSPSGSGGLSGFGDASSVSGYAAGAVSWAVGCGILQGSDGLLHPQATATRAEVATMIMRYAANIPEA